MTTTDGGRGFGDRLHHRVRAEPRLLLAGKTAAAAALAWLLVQPLGGFVQNYPYYAPLGATVAMTTSIVSTVRTAAQTVVAIFVGACIGLALRSADLPQGAALSGAVGVAVVVGAGSVLATWSRLGAMGSYVPVAGLFTLILGGSDPWHYVAAYCGLMALGALVGVAVNLVLPQYPLRPVLAAQRRLRTALADQLEELVRGLRSEEPMPEDHWDRLRAAAEPELDRVHVLLEEAFEARRGNWRANRWHGAAVRRQEYTRALERLTAIIEQVVALVSDPRSSVRSPSPEGTQLREATAHALHRVAGMLRDSADDAPDDVVRRASWEQAAIAVRQLHRVVEDQVADPRTRDLTAVAIAVGLQHAVETWY